MITTRMAHVGGRHALQSVSSPLPPAKRFRRFPEGLDTFPATFSKIRLSRRCLLSILLYKIMLYIEIMLHLKSRPHFQTSTSPTPAPSTWPRHVPKLDDATPHAPGAAHLLGSPALNHQVLQPTIIWHVSRGLPQSTPRKKLTLRPNQMTKCKWELKPMCNKVSAEDLWKPQKPHHNFPALHGHTSVATTRSTAPSGNAPRAAACNCQ